MTMPPGPDERTEVLHLPDEHRFVVRFEGAEAELTYRVRGDRMILVHTGVPDELAGRGIGALLVDAAVRHAVSKGLAVVPWCPFAREYLRQHPEAATSATIDWTPPPGSPTPSGAAFGASDAADPGRRVEGHLDEQEEESFPASDPHSDWAGPPS